MNNLSETPGMDNQKTAFIKKRGVHLLTLIVFTGILFSATITFHQTTFEDFSSGEPTNIDIITPDPDGLDDGALQLTEFDTIYVLQVYPDGHCTDCITDVVYTYESAGTPALTFKFFVTTLSEYNTIHSPDDVIRMADSHTWELVEMPVDFFHIIFFGIANGFGGRSNDLNNHSKNATIEFAQRGKGLVLTHDTIAKRRGWSWETPACTDTRDFEHDQFNSLTPVTGLTADWVTCYEPDHIFNDVEITASADPSAIVLNVPFDLPPEFEVTDCHDFGETYAAGDLWYTASDGRIYMHTYNDPDYNSFSAFFSTGHAEDYDGDDFRPAEWETKAMINSMYYAYNGGEGVGVYLSDIWTLPGDSDLDSISWSATVPEYASLRVQAKVSTDGTSWTDWYDIVSGDPITGVEFRHLQFRVLMDRGVERPILHWIKIFADVPSPEVTVLSPLEYSSCPCAKVLFGVESEAEIVPNSWTAYVEGISSSPSDFEWSEGNLLLNMPRLCFTSGDTVHGFFAEIRNTLGFSLVDSVNFSYVVDLDPPHISGITPPPDTLFSYPWFDVVLYIEDDLAGVIYDSITVTLNGEVLESGVWDPATGMLFFDHSRVHAADSVTICVHAADMAEMCGGNILDSCWSFYVDTIGPVVELVEPDGYTSCDSLYAVFHIQDQSGVDITTVTISHGSESWSWPDAMTWDGEYLTFDPVIWFEESGIITISFDALSDIAGNDIRETEFTIRQDLFPPEVTSSYPAPGAVMGDSINNIYFELHDDLSGVDTDSVMVYIDGTLITTWSFDGTGFNISDDIVPHYVDGETCHVCIVFDDHAIQCGSNADSVCWEWTVNLAGPMASLVMPGGMSTTSCNEGPILVYLEDPNGVNEVTVSIRVDGSLYSWDSPAVDFSNDTITYTPGLSWHHGDTIRVEIGGIEDMIGNLMADTLETWFLVDLEPPVITPIYPPIGVYVPPAPKVSIYLYDELSGIDPDSVWVWINDMAYRPTDPGCGISNDTFYIDLEAAGVEHGDTVCLEVVAMDSVAYCSRNRSELEYCFYVDQGGPRAVFVEPPGNVWTSCADQKISLVLTDMNGINWSSVDIVIGSDTLHYGDARLSLHGDTLVYTHASSWESSDTIVVLLISAEDNLGNQLLTTTTHTFMVDIDPPVLDVMYPAPGAIITDPFDTPWFVCRDSLSGLDPSSVRLRSMGSEWGYYDTRTNGDTIFFDADFLGIHFPERETTDVVLIMKDMAMFCESNAAACTTYFYLPDDDTLPPVYMDHAPKLWVEDSSFAIYAFLKDTSDLYAPTDTLDAQAAYLEWDIDGELTMSRNRRFFEAFDETTLVTSIPIMGLPAGTVVTARVKAGDNDFDFNVRDDRSAMLTEIFEIVIVPRPVVSLIHPESGSFISCPDQPISFLIQSDTELALETLELTIAGNHYRWPDSHLQLRNDTLTYTPAPEESEGQLPITLASLEDVNGYPAISASWELFIDTTPPAISFNYPEPDQMVPSDGPYVRFGVNDALSGTDLSSIFATVVTGSDDTVGTYSAGDCIDTETMVLDFEACAIPYQDGDSFTVYIYAEDSPDICQPNGSGASIMFWVEPVLGCELSTNPFTPNMDSYNDDVMFFFPDLYSIGGTVTIFDLRGNPVCEIDVPAGELKDSVWDGKSDTGKDMPSGNYLYVVESNGERVCKGTVTLAR